MAELGEKELPEKLCERKTSPPTVKNESAETVNVTLTVPLSPAFYKMLKGLSEITGLSIETMLVSDLFTLLTCYFGGGHYNGWIDYANQKTKALEKEMAQIEATLP